jgi:hypothetical protein
MNSSVTFLRWSGLLAVIALAWVFLFRPHYLGLAENPDIKIMTSEVLISGRSFKDQKSKDLHSEHGCKFWKFQEQALDSEIKSAEFLIQINTDAKNKANEFIKNYPEMKSELESKHLTDKKTGEVKFFTTLRVSQMKSLERNLEKNKKELEQLPALIEQATSDKINLEADKEIAISMAKQCTTQPNTR